MSAVLSLVARAAETVLDIYRTDFGVQYKSPGDPVTVADQRANALLCAGLHDIFPDAVIVAEESKPEAYAGYQNAERVLFVDPLDGTKEFIRKNGEFVVMLGLVEDNEAVMSVIHAPALEMVWYGQVGSGAFLKRGDAEPERITVSRAEDLAEARIVASRSHRDQDVQKALDVLGAGSLDALGSAGLKGAHVAMAEAEAYVSPSGGGKRWDACAVDGIVKAAGGRVTDAHGQPFDYRTDSLRNSKGLLATNGLVHDALLERLVLAREGRG